MGITSQTLHEDMIRIQKDLEAIKKILLSEGELSERAKEALERARQAPRESYTRLDDVKAEILAA